MSYSYNEFKRLKESEPITASIGIVYAGGTIASLVTEEGHRSGDTKDLAKLYGEIHPDATIGISQKTFAYSGLSENLTEEDQTVIIGAIEEQLDNGVKSVVITHGTDTLEQTARLLDAVFGPILEPDQKIILTAANEDISHPDTDAWDNIQLSFETANDTSLSVGVYVAFGGKIIPAGEVVKMPFETGKPAAYGSDQSDEYGEAMFEQVARHEVLAEKLQDKFGLPKYLNVLPYDVNKISMDHSELIEYIRNNYVKAMVFKLYHSGTANTETPGESVSELVEYLSGECGIVCFGATETDEPTALDKYDTSVRLRKSGLVPLYDMPVEVASEKLLRMPDCNAQELIVRMLTNACGEIDESQINIEHIQELFDLYSS